VFETVGETLAQIKSCAKDGTARDIVAAGR